MENAGETNLAKVIRAGALALPDFLDVAAQLAETVAHLHRARVVHCDINPSNIVWDGTTRRASLSDFGIARTLAYVSPESTGRIGRSIDSRTDLYSLGATFYEMLTGTPPFAAQDAVELAHAHIARRPHPPHELNTEVPLAVSLIVLKLLEKEPAQRYQTADSLAIDLCEAKAQWLRAQTIAPFPLASHDVPRELQIPEKLYGRDEELQTLDAAFARACQGGRELVLVTGAAGIGKTALVSELGRLVAEQPGFYIAGKFDQLQRSVPFSGLAQAFQALVRQILIEPDATLASWRERIEAAVAPNGQLLVEIVPELERILGPQPAVPEVGPVESTNRFRLVFTRFVSVFAQREHPLILFLDDLQWIDAASLQLLEQWLGDTALHYLLLLGACRDSELRSSHPLTVSLAAWRAAEEVNEIHLGPIGRDEIAQLTAETVNADVAETQSLADLIVRKTAGNPFFVRRLLHVLHAQGLIRFLAESRTWQWDVIELEQAPISDNVLDLMVHAIERLPASTRALLEIGSCFGHRFDLDTLAEVSGLSRTTATAQLWPALEGEMLVPIRDANKALEVTLDALPVMFRFAHDRVQQAAYSMLSEERRRALHLDIGRRLLDHADNGQLDELLFDIVDQLDLGQSLIVDPAERARLVELNLAAGRRAKASAAYQAACDYLAVAMRHLPAEPWLAQSELTFTLHRELAESAYLTGQHARAEELIEIALAHASSKVAKADLYSLRVLAATVVGNWPSALRWGHEGLAVFGHEWPLEGLADANEAEAAAVMPNVGDRRIEDLLDAPEVKDDETRACMRLLSILGPPAYFSGDDVLTFLVTRAANLSLLHGPSPYSAYAYVFYGALHNERTGEYGVGYAFGKLALALARRFADRAEECRTLEVFALLVHPWKAPLRESLPLVREGVRAGVESGELAYAAFNLNSVLINGLPAGVSLADLLSDADITIEFATKHRNRTSTEIALPFRQFARALMGATRSPGSFDDEDFAEARFLEEARDNRTALGNFWVARLQAAYLLGDYASARRSSLEGARHMAGILGMAPSAEHVFYTALTLAADVGTTSDSELRSLHEKLITWAKHCPENFAHKAALVGAELARLGGASAEALKLYRAALDGAAQQQFIQDQTLAHELRARFLLSEQEEALAAVHFRAARDGYQQWGATIKVRALERERPDWFAAEPGSPNRRISIDALALIKASQAISAETVSERLFERILCVVAEVAGAQSGALVLCETDMLAVRARIETASGVSVSVVSTPLEQCADLPSTILRYVVRMKKPLVLSNAAAAGAFGTDPAVRLRQLRSVMCVPLTQQAKVIGLLYLENAALVGAFADDLVEIVQVLAAQAVISLENARLHEASALEIEQRKQAEQAEQAWSEANRRKDEFLAMLAHELRNPLAPISAAADLLQIASSDPAMVKKSSAVIARQVRHMTGLVDDLLDVSRVTRGLVNLQQITLDVHQAMRDAIEQVRPLIETRHHELTLRTSHEPALVRADPKRLVQVLTNLLTNAAKYTSKGGRITIELGVDDDICVSDTGQGMSPELLNRCFDLFVQAERTSERAAGGLGIGLALVRSLVELHGGTVRAESEGRGRGSRFTVTLPRVHKAEVPVTAMPADGASSHTTNRLKVLIVDDNHDVAEMLAMLVDALGHETIVEHHPTHALERIARERPDVCLLDVGLPDMDGYELATEIRRRLGPASISLVAITGYGQPEDRKKALAAGFDEHFAKPVNSGELATLLATFKPSPT